MVFDCIFGRDHKKDRVGEDDDIRNLFYVLSLDSGHLLTTKREIERITKKSDMAFPDNLFFVINDVNHSGSFADIADDRRKLLNDALGSIKLIEQERKHVYFIYFYYSENYFKAVTVGNGVAGVKFSTLFSDKTIIHDWENEIKYQDDLFDIVRTGGKQ